jgi:hypothetical protein
VATYERSEDRTASRKRDPNPLNDYLEWIQNRYNPDYFVGGRLSPIMRACQSLLSRAEKRALLILVVIVMLAVAMAWGWALFLPARR